MTAVDRDGRRATAYLAPDRPAHVTGQAVATNHQGQVEWAPYAAAIRTVERQRHLQALLDAGSGVPGVVAACLRPPLYATRFGEGFGTLYTAEYRPENVHHIINVTSWGFVWLLGGAVFQGVDIDGAENLRLTDVGHSGVPTHPKTLALLTAGLAEVAAKAKDETAGSRPAIEKKPDAQVAGVAAAP